MLSWRDDDFYPPLRQSLQADIWFVVVLWCTSQLIYCRWSSAASQNKRMPTKVDGCFFSYSFGQSSSKTNIFLVFLIDPPLTMVVFTYNIIQKLNNSEFCISIFSCQQLKNYKMSIFLSMPKTQAVLGPQSVLGPLLYGPKHRAGLSTRSTERTRSIIVWTKIAGAGYLDRSIYLRLDWGTLYWLLVPPFTDRRNKGQCSILIFPKYWERK